MIEWDVYVEHFSHECRTVLKVGNQYFTLAHESGGDEFERTHQCEFMKAMMLKALENLGIDPETRTPRE
jgi:hypothetical protein